MSDPISLALGTKEIVSIIGLLIGGNFISFKYIFNGKLNQIDKLDQRVTKVEQHRWAELNRMGSEFREQLVQINSRIDEIFKILSKH